LIEGLLCSKRLFLHFNYICPLTRDGRYGRYGYIVSSFAQSSKQFLKEGPTQIVLSFKIVLILLQTYWVNVHLTKRCVTDSESNQHRWQMFGPSHPRCSRLFQVSILFVFLKYLIRIYMKKIKMISINIYSPKIF